MVDSYSGLMYTLYCIASLEHEHELCMTRWATCSITRCMTRIYTAIGSSHSTLQHCPHTTWLWWWLSIWLSCRYICRVCTSEWSSHTCICTQYIQYTPVALISMCQLVNIINLVIHALDMCIWTVIIVQSRLLCKPYMTSHVKYPIKHPVMNTTRNTNSGSPSIDQQLQTISNYHAQLIAVHTSYNQSQMTHVMMYVDGAAFEYMAWWSISNTYNW